MEFESIDLSSNNEPFSQIIRDNSSNTSNTYIPKVREERKPKIGQEFVTLDEVYAFYNDYAREAGFSIRIGSSRKCKKKGRENEITMKEYVCFKKGEKVIKKGGEGIRRRGNFREGCKARLQVVKSETDTVFKVHKFDEGHNHDIMSPTKVPFLRSHRHVSHVKKCLTEQFMAANIPTCQQMSFLEVQAGGLGNVGCLEKDIRNEIGKMRKLTDGKDSVLVHEYFMAEKAKNPSFCYVIEADDVGKVTHIFWADGEMRKAYSHFGDVVVFDTTYQTNKYGMIFAPFLGVNNHWHTVTFSGAFLSDESVGSFEWLISQLLKFMPGPPPKMIITDQDLAMEKAIATKLPQTLHRYCIWHITNKFSEKMGTCRFEEYIKDFRSCIWDSDTKEDFDAKWWQLLEKSNLKEHKWFISLFEIREKWVPAYVRHIFSAGMSSSQRAESNHAFFKRLVNDKHSLMEFILKFTKGVAKQRHVDLNEDFVNLNEQPSLKTPLPMEKQMAQIYTRFIFYKFQDELWQSWLYDVHVNSTVGCKSVYTVSRNDGKSRRERKLEKWMDLDCISCSCRKFDSEGVPCRHLLAYLKQQDITQLPSKFILKRWTKGATLGRVDDACGVEYSDACDTALLSRRSTLCQVANNLIDDALGSDDNYRMVKENMERLHGMIKSSASCGGVGVSTQCKEPSTSTYREPSPVSFKGSGRIKSLKEMKAKSKGRHCNYCKRDGVTHDARNCPKKRKRGPNVLGSPSGGFAAYEEDITSIGGDGED